MKRINEFRPRPSILLGLVLLCLLPLAGFAQNARLQLNNLEKLSDKAVEANDVALDGATLLLASSFMKMDHDPKALQINDILRNLKGIYVKNYKFSQPNEYSQSDVDNIRVQLGGPGWSRIVENRDKSSGATNEIYFMKDGDNIAGVAILVAEPKELTVVNIVGSIDLSKLGALAGNFGIPNVGGQSPNKPTADTGSGNAVSGPFQAGTKGNTAAAGAVR
jgi:hypothetical protein